MKGRNFFPPVSMQQIGRAQFTEREEGNSTVIFQPYPLLSY